MRNAKAVTLIEVLVGVTAVSLLLTLALPGFSPRGSKDKIARCASNLRGIGQAMYLYAQDDPQVFPAIANPRDENDGLMRVFHPDDRIMQPSTTGIPSPTVDLWALVRPGIATPSEFICPRTKDRPDPAQYPADYYDFLSADHLSYAYHFQHDPDQRVIGTSSDPGFPILADGNPYIKGGIERDIYTDRLSGQRGNTKNHRSRRQGQNVLFQDSHVNLEETPGVGLYGPVDPELGSFGWDNIYTVFEDVEPVIMDPGSAAPTSTWCNLGGKSDACLVP